MAVKILAADDSVTMRRVLEMTFAGEGVHLEAVDSGEAAVERASQSPPDLIIADASMSMSGYDVAKAIKGNPATQQVAVIVLASQHTPFDSAKGKESGVDGHLLKPYDSQAMIDKAKEVLSKPRATVAGGASPVAAAARPSAPGVGRPASASPSALRSTVSFGTPAMGAPGNRPVLELAEEDPPAARSAKPAVPKLPPRPPLKKPPARAPIGSKPAGLPASRAAARPARSIAKPAAKAPSSPGAQAKPAQASPAQASPAQASPAQANPAAAAATAATGTMAGKLAELGLTQAQVEGVLALSKDAIERVVWEVVPDLAEAIIKEEIRRLTAG